MAHFISKQIMFAGDICKSCHHCRGICFVKLEERLCIDRDPGQTAIGPAESHDYALLRPSVCSEPWLGSPRGESEPSSWMARRAVHWLNVHVCGSGKAEDEVRHYVGSFDPPSRESRQCPLSLQRRPSGSLLARAQGCLPCFWMRLRLLLQLPPGERSEKKIVHPPRAFETSLGVPKDQTPTHIASQRDEKFCHFRDDPKHKLMNGLLSFWLSNRWRNPKEKGAQHKRLRSENNPLV